MHDTSTMNCLNASGKSDDMLAMGACPRIVAVSRRTGIAYTQNAIYADGKSSRCDKGYNQALGRVCPR